MRYAARLSKLEAAAGFGLRGCPGCRLFLRLSWRGSKEPPEPEPAPDSFVTNACELCGRETRYALTGSEGERQMFRLVLGTRREGFYTDPRAWAARCWYTMRAEAKRERRSAERAVKGQGTSRARGQYRGADERDRGPGAKLYDALLEEYQSAVRRVDRNLRARYGSKPFPELEARFAAAQAPDYEARYKGEAFAWRVPFSPMYGLGRAARAWAYCAEVERYVLGHVLPETKAALDDCSARADGLIAEARAKHEEEEAAKRRREEERERERLERLEARRQEEERRHDPTASARDHRFWREGAEEIKRVEFLTAAGRERAAEVSESVPEVVARHMAERPELYAIRPGFKKRSDDEEKNGGVLPPGHWLRYYKPNG